MLKKQNYKKVKLVLNHQIKKQAESQVRGAGNFVGCAAKFAGCQILQPPNFQDCSFNLQ